MAKKIFFILLSIFHTTALVSMDNQLSLPQSSNIETDMVIRAEFGDPKALIFFAHKCYESGNHNEAAKWISRYKIRARQDAVCSKESVTEDALSIAIKHFKDLYPTLTQQQTFEMFREQIRWVEERTNKNLLGSPYWIAQYGTGTYLGTSNRILFIRPEEWEAARKAVVAEYLKSFNHPEQWVSRKKTKIPEEEI